MCRNIRQLYNFEPHATSEEVNAAALQYVRKVSGMPRPSHANQAAFDAAVAEIAHVTEHLLADLVTSAPAKDREVERAKARARNEKRFGAAAARDYSFARTGGSKSWVWRHFPNRKYR